MFTIMFIFSSQWTPSARSRLVCVLTKQTCWFFWRKNDEWKGPQYVAVSIIYWLVTCLQVFFCTGNYSLFVFFCKKTAWSGKIPKLNGKIQELYCNILCNFLFVRTDIIKLVSKNLSGRWRHRYWYRYRKGLIDSPNDQIRTWHGSTFLHSNTCTHCRDMPRLTHI